MGIGPEERTLQFVGVRVIGIGVGVVKATLRIAMQLNTVRYILKPVRLYDDVVQDGRYNANIIENAYADEIRAFFDYVQKGDVPPYTFDEDAHTLAVVDEIEGLFDFGAAFVGVKAPSACAVVVVGIDVVDMVVGDGRAVGSAERIDAAHVGEDALADIMDVVVVDVVAMGDGVAVAPCPSHGDARVEEIADLVVCQRVVAGVADPDAVGAVMEAAAVGDDAVVDGDEIRHLRMVFRNDGRADFDAAATQIMDMAMRHGDAMAAEPPPEAHDADGTDFATVEGAVFDEIALDDGFHVDFRLAGVMSRQRKDIGGVAEGQSVEMDIGDRRSGFAFELQERRRDGNGENRLVRRFAGQRGVGQRAIRGDKPFARRHLQRGHVFQMVALTRAPMEERPAGGAFQHDESCFEIDGFDVEAAAFP